MLGNVPYVPLYVTDLVALVPVPVQPVVALIEPLFAFAVTVYGLAVAFAVYAQFPEITALYAFVVLIWVPPLVWVHLLQVYPVSAVAPNVTVAPVI